MAVVHEVLRYGYPSVKLSSPETKLKFSTRAGSAMVLTAWAVAATFHCMAQPVSSNIEPLINRDKWKEASRAILLEARSASKYELSIPPGQAKAGFLDDALDTIAIMPPNSQPAALLALVAAVPSMEPKKSAELVQRAHTAAREMSGPYSNFLKSGPLTQVALFHLRNAAEADARVVFEESLRAAEIGAAEENSGGYQQITQAMLGEAKSCPDWMIALVAKHLQRDREPANTAFAYRDLAQVAIQRNRNELASSLIEPGVSAAKAIKHTGRRKLALEELARVSAQAGYTKGVSDIPPDGLAIQEARAGHPQKAWSIASGLSANLYVDHGLAAYESVFNDAVKRGDLRTALYFAEHPLREGSSMETNVWRQLAELQVRLGAKKEAANSYLRAAQSISNGPQAVPSFQQIEVMAALGLSMRENGFETEGRRIILDAAAKADSLPERPAKDRVRANTLVADALWRLGLRSEAKQNVLRAYRVAREFDAKNNMDKAHLLANLGHATASFIAKAGDGQASNREPRK